MRRTVRVSVSKFSITANLFLIRAPRMKSTIILATLAAETPSLDFARLSYIIFHGKPTLQSYKYSKVLQTCICIYSYIAYCQVSDQTPQWLPIARGLCRTPIVDATQQEDIVCHSAGRHCGQALTEARSPSSSVGTATRSSSWRKDIPQW